MKKNIKYIAKLSTTVLFSFLKINILATFSTITVAVIGFFLLTKNINMGNSGHVSSIPFLLMTFLNRPIGSTLWYLICFGSPVLFFILGNKYILQKITYKIITDNSQIIINQLLDKTLNKFKDKQPEVLKNTGDFSLNKLKLIQEIRNDKSENKWLRKVLIFGMKKINLDDIDFNNENQNFFDIIKVKTTQSLQNISKPSKKIIWIAFSVQWLFLIFIWLTKY